MCGFAGLWDLAAATPADVLAAQAEAMAAPLAHRGPDDAGVWADAAAGVGLGHRRLAVVDLSPAGHQPMVSADGRWVLAFNGEVYNAASLRERLADRRIAWRGSSDTEVLVEAVAAWGVRATLVRADAMAAFAAWDRDRRELWLARDRFGEKPLYWGCFGDVVLFGSELGALRAHRAFRPSLDREALAAYFGALVVPSPRTVFRGVHTLAPGHLVCLRGPAAAARAAEPLAWWSPVQAAAVGLAATTGFRAARKAWRLGEFRRSGRFADPPAAREATPPTLAPLRPDEAVDGLEEVLGASVASRLIADVPVGAFLSGGTDSTSIVALAARHASGPVRTFTIGFDDPAFDESGPARHVASLLGCDHTELVVSASEVRALIPRLPAVYGEPFADASQLPVLLVSELARRDVTVALSGDGGDELFGGYVRHALAAGPLGAIDVLPDGLRRRAGEALRSVPPERWEATLGPVLARAPARFQVSRPGERVHRLAGVLAAPDGGYAALARPISDLDGVVLGAVDPAGAVPPALGGFRHPLDRALLTDTAHYLPDDLLVKVDRASMQVALEVRVPFLSPDVYAYAWGLPRRWKVRGGVGKWILRRMAARFVPPELLARPKMGFGVPVGAWLRGPLRPWADALLDPGRLADEGILDAGLVRAVWEDHQAHRRDAGLALWAVLQFQAWMDAQPVRPG